MSTKDINFWLNDKELKTPEHDKLVLWTFDNVEKVMENLSLIPIHKHISFDKNSYGGEWNWDKKKYILDNKKPTKYESQSKKDEEESWEYYKKLDKKREEENNFYTLNKKIEFAIGEKYNLGFIDLAVFVKPNEISYGNFHELWEYHENLYFEIKPIINSIGEVMRQINYYRKYIKGEFIIVTKTKGLKDIFKTQNVHIVEYEDEQKELFKNE